MVHVIGVAGGSGSGKTTLVDHICEQLGPENVLLVQHDRYYRSFDELTFEEKQQINYDHPDSLDTELFVKNITQLKAGQPTELPFYDFSTFSRTDETETATPKPVLLIEGILIFCEAQLRDLIDFKLFVDTDADVRFGRRLQRDVQERGRSYEFGIQQYLKYTRPMHLEFVEPSKRYADLIIPEGGKNPRALAFLNAYLQKLVSEEI